MNAHARIMRHVTEEPNTGCWLWTGFVGKHGYPYIGMRTPTGYRPVRAGRAMLQVATGDIGEGMEACHKCHQKSCVNPAHLYWGTRSQNCIDSINRGSGRTQKLDAAAVMRIVERVRSGEMVKAVAPDFGVTPGTVSNIIHGATWGHVTGIRRSAA
jgi:hypothetical protein